MSTALRPNSPERKLPEAEPVKAEEKPKRGRKRKPIVAASPPMEVQVKNEPSCSKEATKELQESKVVEKSKRGRKAHEPQQTAESSLKKDPEQPMEETTCEKQQQPPPRRALRERKPLVEELNISDDDLEQQSFVDNLRCVTALTVEKQKSKDKEIKR